MGAGDTADLPEANGAAGTVSWSAQRHSSTGPGRKGWAHGAGATPAGPSVSFLAVLEFSMETMVLETAHVWTLPQLASFIMVCMLRIDAFNNRFAKQPLYQHP
jgi:hypothetical protein